MLPLASVQCLCLHASASLVVAAETSPLFKHHTFVGMVTETMGLLQHGTQLHLMDVQQVSQQMFYQQVRLLLQRLEWKLACITTCPTRCAGGPYCSCVPSESNHTMITT